MTDFETRFVNSDIACCNYSKFSLYNFGRFQVGKKF